MLYMAVGATVKDQALAFAGAGFEVVHTPALAVALQALAAPRASHSEPRPAFDVVVTKLGSTPDDSDQLTLPPLLAHLLDPSSGISLHRLGACRWCGRRE